MFTRKYSGKRSDNFMTWGKVENLFTCSTMCSLCTDLSKCPVAIMVVLNIFNKARTVKPLNLHTSECY